jgi:hypothetical protein
LLCDLGVFAIAAPERVPFLRSAFPTLL